MFFIINFCYLFECLVNVGVYYIEQSEVCTTQIAIKEC